MSPLIEWHAHSHAVEVPPSVFARVMQALCEGEGQALRIDVHGIDDAASAALHLRHSGIPGPTDVLAFPYERGPFEDEDELMGEVFVDLDLAAREGAQRGHGGLAEALFYAAHGVLHLLGYDDHDAAGRAEMHRRQALYLKAAGIAVID